MSGSSTLDDTTGENTQNTNTMAADQIPTFKPSGITITKLTDDNFHVWRTQLLPYLRGQGVYGFLDRTIPKPPSTVTTAANGSKPNPQFLQWSKTDATILSLMTTSIDDKVLSRYSGAEFSADLWERLNTSFAAHSKSRVVFLRRALSHTPIDTMSARDYYHKMKGYADELSLAGSPISDDEFITDLLAGLSREYDALVQMVPLAKPSPDELYALLLNAEQRVMAKPMVV